jgi:hypothetical protein
MMSAYLYVFISAEVGAGAFFALSRSRAQSQKKITKARRKKSAKNSMDTTLHLSTTPLSKLANKFLCQQSNLKTQMIIIQYTGCQAGVVLKTSSVLLSKILK